MCELNRSPTPRFLPAQNKPGNRHALPGRFASRRNRLRENRADLSPPVQAAL
jgi:hypothetical protein